MRVMDLRSTLIMIFRPDELPYGALSRDDAAEDLLDRYGLAQEKPPFAIPGTQANLLYRNGKVEIGGSQRLIDQIAIEPRRMLITVSGETHIAQTLFEELRGYIRNVELRQTDYAYEPVSLTHETQATTQMTFDFSSLFAGSAVPVVKSHLSASLPDYGATLDIYPISVRFRVGYRNPPASLARSRISLVEKTLTLEIKEKTDPADRILFSTSPSDSATHLSLLETLEQMVQDSERPRTSDE